MATTQSEREAEQIAGVALPEESHELIGHEAVRHALERQILSAHLPGAWLLHGPRGVGKATLAFSMARQLLALTGDESAERVDGQVAQGTHPNLFILRKKPKDGKGFYSVIRVVDVRDIRDRMHRTRGRAGYRICVVDAIDDCNANAANALLKILEEPPSRTLFILISHRPGALLPTIRSRCQSHALRPLNDTQMHEVLAQFGHADPQQDILRFAAGRPRRVHQLGATGQTQALADLAAWLDRPDAAPAGTHLGLADTLAGGSDTEAGLARELMLEALAQQARQQAIARGAGPVPLASAAELWEKASQAFASADTYNLDMRQTYVSLFDGYLDFWRSRPTNST